MGDRLPQLTEPAPRPLVDELDRLGQAASRGEYELLLAEVEGCLMRLFPGAVAKVVIHGAAGWEPWPASAQPGGGVVVADGAAAVRTSDHLLVPVVPGTLALWITAAPPGMQQSEALAVVRQFFALALQNCERQRIASQSLEEVQALHRVATRILKSHDLGEILLLITQEARHLLAADICGVLLHDDSGIAMRRCIGNRSAETAALRMRAGQGLAGLVLQQRKPAAVEDYLASDEISHDFFHLAHEEQVRSALAAPLLARDSVIGVLEVWRRRPSTFTPLDTMRLVALANLAAIALENAELYATQERMVSELARTNSALNTRYDLLRGISELTQRLTMLLLEGGGVPAIATAAASFIGADLAVLDEAGGVSAWTGAAAPGPALAQVQEELRKAGAARRESAGGLLLHAGRQRWCAQPVLVEGGNSGWIAAPVAEARDDVVRLTLAHAAMLLALHQLEQRAARRARAETIDAVIWDLLRSDEAGRAAALDRAADVRLELEGPLRLFLCEIGPACAVEGPGEPASLRRVAAACVREQDGLRAVAIQGNRVAVVCTAPALDVAERIAQRLARMLADALPGRQLLVGGSGECQGALGLAGAYREALIARDVARQVGGAHAAVYDRTGVLGMLLGLRHQAGMRRFLELHLGPLLAEEERQRDLLLETLRVFFDANCSHEAASQRLGVHRKTIAHRLAKITELTGLDFTTHDDRLLADLSLYVHRMLARRTPQADAPDPDTAES